VKVLRSTSEPPVSELRLRTYQLERAKDVSSHATASFGSNTIALRHTIE
jgi:hypothetical protein